MSQLFVELWNDYGLVKIIGFVVVILGALRMINIRFNSSCPQCGSRFKKVDEENNLIERITNSMTTRSLIDPALPDTSFYRCKGCNFETKSLDQLALEANLSESNPYDSTTTGFK